MSNKDDKVKQEVEPLVCWIALVGQFLSMCTAAGVMRSYGLLYLEWLHKFDQGPQKTGLIGTIFGVSYMLSCPCYGLMADKYESWKLMVLASVSGTIASLLPAFASNIFMVYIGSGIVLGFGNAGFFVLSLYDIVMKFKKSKTLAVGIGISGASIGGLVFPPFLQSLFSVYAINGTFLIVAGFYANMINTAVLMKCASHLKHSLQLREAKINKTKDHIEQIANVSEEQTEKEQLKKKKLFTKETFKQLCGMKYILVNVFMIFFSFAYYGYPMYFPPLAEEYKLTGMQYAVCLSVYGATDALGRVLIGYIAGLHWVNIYMLIIGNTFISGTISFLLPAVLYWKHIFIFPAFIVHFSLMGLLIPGLQSLQGRLIEDAVGIGLLGTGSGFLNLSFGIGTSLVPIFYDSLKVSLGSYICVVYCTGAALFLCSATILVQYLLGCNCRRVQPYPVI